MEYLKVIISIVLGYIANFFIPILPFLVIVVFLVFADTFTGIKAAQKEGLYKENKASGGWRNTINKISQYFVAILLAQGMVLAFSISPTYLPLTYIVALYIALVEFKSNLENIAVVTGVDIWRVVKGRLKVLLHQKQENETEEKEQQDNVK